LDDRVGRDGLQAPARRLPAGTPVTTMPLPSPHRSAFHVSIIASVFAHGKWPRML